MNENLQEHLLTVLQVSTAHVSEEEGRRATAAEDLGDTTTVMTGEYGWLTYVPPEALAKAEPTEVSEGLRTICKLARDNGINYILFDRDIALIDGVAHYDW